MGQNFSPYFIAFPPGAGIARFVTDCSTIVQKLIFAFDIAFPPGGRCRRTATDEGQPNFRFKMLNNSAIPFSISPLAFSFGESVAGNTPTPREVNF